MPLLIPTLSAVLEELLIGGLEMLDESAYLRVLELEARADALGYIGADVMRMVQ